MIGKNGSEADRGWVAFDPRARILALLFFLAAVCGTFTTTILFSLFSLYALLIVPAGLTFRETARRLYPVNLFLCLIWMTMPFLTAGPQMRVGGLLSLSVPGAQQALIMTLKANALVLATSVILYPVEIGSLAAGLRRLGVPVKLVWLFLLSHRYVFGLADKTAKSLLAIRMRSGNGRKMQFRAYGGLLAKLFVVGHQSGERLHIAMRARGYGERLSLHRDMAWRMRDSLLVAGALLVAVAAVGLERMQ